MNLVQIQERLKDLPTQAVMAYANGQNPQVPPYLALGELNRRKQMEQQAAQPPQGTVKDNIEQLYSYPLMRGVKLGDATRSQVKEQSDFHRKIALDASHKVAWFDSIVAIVPDGARVRDVISKEQLFALFTEARR